MKYLFTILLATAVIFNFSCKKDSDDPVEDYSIKYTVVSNDSVKMDTIMYLDADGVEKYLFGEGNLTHSFTQPSNNYHAKLYVSGNTGNIGSSNYSVQVLDQDSGVVDLKESSTSGTDINFTWTGEVSHYEN